MNRMGVSPQRLVASLDRNSLSVARERFGFTDRNITLQKQSTWQHDKLPVLSHRGTRYLRERNVRPMDAVLPWPWQALTCTHQEPNSSFGGHALTVSLWKQICLRLTELCSHGYYGCARSFLHQSVFRQQEQYCTFLCKKQGT
jgi:hypothetical protein